MTLVGYSIAERHLPSLGIHEAILIMLRRMGVPVPEPAGYEPPSHSPFTDASSNTFVSSRESGDGVSLIWPSTLQLTPDPDRQHTLITSHEPGQTLAEAWPAFSPPQKQFVRDQLTSIFGTLRSIRPAADHIWRPHRFPFLPMRDRFWLRQTTNQPMQEFNPGNPEFRQRYGPFASHDGFVVALAERVAAVASFALDEEEEADVLNAIAHLRGTEGSDFVFTHGNFAPRTWSYWEWVKARLAVRQDVEQEEDAFVSEGGLDVIEPGVGWEKELWSVEAGHDVIW
ncbi:hypothetical protein ACHAQH_000777 [Verticillium albo-atrum]